MSREEDTDRAGNRQSPMTYDGGLRTGGDDPYTQVYYPHPPLACPQPRYGTLRNKYRCPGCGAKIRVARETYREYGYRVTEPFRRIVGSALAAPFRRAPAKTEEIESMSLECVVCRAYLVQEDDENGDAHDATTILDGNAVCDEHARSMIAVIAAKLPKRETA